MWTVVLVLIVAVLGFVLGYYLSLRALKSKNEDYLKESEKKLEEAEMHAKKMISEARSKLQKKQEELDLYEKTKRSEFSKLETKLLTKDEELEQKIELAEAQRETLEKKINEVHEAKNKLKSLLAQQDEELQKVAGLNKKEAKDLLFKKVETDYQEELALHLKEIERQVTAEAQEKAKMVVALAMQKYAAETASENTATIVQLPSDDMKGRIIGREGRNIMAFEHATGVDVIVDETPETVILSGFDLLRRYIAKVSLERLLVDGRIHPARIEEVVGKVKEEINDLIKDLGEKAVFETGVVGLPSELVKLLGRLKFRTGYGQNVLKHSIEVAHLAGAIASELGADVALCKKAGLLHDIGKAVDHDTVGHHAQIGADLCKKFGLSENIISIVGAHHSEKELPSLEAIVVYVANMISNNRPGLDQNNLENFIKRMTDLENIANSFEGVTNAYAIHTGKEVRVIVNSEVVDDLQSIKLANNIARQIEGEVQSSNPVKVDVIREVRYEATAL